MAEQNKTDNVGSKKSLNMKIKPTTFDGFGNWLDYRAHFEVCTELNGWTEKERGMYLAVSLRGKAQGVFENLAGGIHNYTELIKTLEWKRDLCLQIKQSFIEFSYESKDRRPTPADLRITLAKEQFIDAQASSDMWLRIKQARSAKLNDAVHHAVELEALNRTERHHLEGQGYMRVTSEKPSEENSDF